MSLPLEVERFFEEKRREQQNLNSLALVNANLRDTIITMHGVVEKTNRRGMQLEMIEEESDVLLESSEKFLRETKCCNWWWCYNEKRATTRKSK